MWFLLSLQINAFFYNKHIHVQEWNLWRLIALIEICFLELVVSSHGRLHSHAPTQSAQLCGVYPRELAPSCLLYPVKPHPLGPNMHTDTGNEGRRHCYNTLTSWLWHVCTVHTTCHLRKETKMNEENSYFGQNLLRLLRNLYTVCTKYIYVYSRNVLKYFIIILYISKKNRTVRWYEIVEMIVRIQNQHSNLLLGRIKAFCRVSRSRLTCGKCISRFYLERDNYI